MSEHYFSHKPQSKSSPKTWTYQLKEKEYTFTSDVGVFSKNEVDFGTRLLIEQFKPPAIEGDFLDLGCGYGPIGIVLADNNRNRNVVMSDVNERAIMLAVQNANQNNISNAEFVQSDRFTNLRQRSFGAVITNPPIRAGKKIVHKMFEDSKCALCKNGDLWVVIQKKQGAPSAMDKMEEIFGNVEVVARKKGYFILRSSNS
ncbi:class I SAM-dependent methyltransferase [Virgibacillus alimentarius]|uniref:16S rRNA (Guanine1207-N2)-methyltransferase n=1 Tax=Virgibacillus alimentarius TaxID=698769 RepID=A0ABS4S9Q0_9BACI|nr:MULTISPECIES: class I SAM-dependent methyltransferase [Virgibacillus]MBP2258047.1 16S rRNA (guanine1207-N2)-methyltransferase [Virgibacillus alimentarius]HLR65885.1 class I SAM-dependent methyltransferase [Virgibacillus sp.]